MTISSRKEGKAIPITVSETPRHSHFLVNLLTGGAEFVKITHNPTAFTKTKKLRGP
jgi:hypothetical protein